MLKRIVRLSHPGPLASFSWPTGASSLEDFRRFNLIYGWNGSGKTTVSRVLRALENRQVPSDCEVELSVDGRRIRESAFGAESVAIRVFNSDFVSDSVLALDSAGVAPIYVLGEQSVTQQQEVESLKRQREKLDALLEARRRQRDAASDALDKHRIDRAKEIKEALRSPGQNEYNNYTKSTYRARAERMLSEHDPTVHRLNSTQRDTLRSQCYATPKPSIVSVGYQLPDITEVAEVACCILETAVASEAIRSLQDDATLSNWVLEGVRIHRLRQSEHCLFCDQELSEARLERLEGHFNAAYENLLTRIDDYIEQLTGDVEAIGRVTLPNAAELYEQFAQDYGGLVNQLGSTLDATTQFLHDVIRELSDKRARAFESYSLAGRPPPCDATIIERINQVIREHNLMCTEFGDRIHQAREQLESGAVADSLEKYVELRKLVDTLDSEIDQLQTQLRGLAREITHREQAIIEYLRPAEELNGELLNYLGHDEIQFTVRDTGYEITRNGVPALSISEGEKTAIALLYFLKSLEDRNFDLSAGIVVLDDPVSSLDANALYAAFGFIRERAKDAAQIIIMTHNFTFLREIKRWFMGGTRKSKSRFFMLDVEFEDGIRCSVLRELDPLLRDYESDYHYLFSQIYRHAQNEARGELGENYVLPNMARRLLERFAAFRWPEKPGGSSLNTQLEMADLDSASKIRIARFVNSYSHSDSIDESEHDPYVLSEAQHVLTDVLSLIRLEDPEHYDRMVALVAR